MRRVIERRFGKRCAKDKKYYERNRERLLDQHHDYYQKNKHRRSIVGAKQTRQIYHERLMALISDNDLKCAWCGFSNIHALQIDHKQGGGSIQHAKQFSDRASFYKHYLDRPELAKNELQLLCSNCNIIKLHQLYKSPIKGGNLNRAD